MHVVVRNMQRDPLFPLPVSLNGNILQNSSITIRIPTLIQLRFRTFHHHKDLSYWPFYRHTHLTSLIPSLRQSLATTNMFVFVMFVIFKKVIYNKWNHVVCNLLRLPFFTHISMEIPPAYCMYRLFLFIVK